MFYKLILQFFFTTQEYCNVHSVETPAENVAAREGTTLDQQVAQAEAENKLKIKPALNSTRGFQ